MEHTMTVGLYSVELPACIGILPQEKMIPQEFLLTVEVSFPGAPVVQNREDLGASVSYAELYELAAKRFRAGGDLLETVAIEIAQEILRQWPIVYEGSIEIIKQNPPIPGIKGNAGIRYFFRKKEA